MNLVGKILNNKYEILEKIGVGGMATVYRAKDKKLNREVAIKVLKDEYTTDSDFIKRFNQEAQSAASLTHPNIVSVYDVGNENEIYYIVMELIKGKTLKEIIKDEGVPSWKWSVNIAKQIALALDTAHKNGLIHRDIKPHNIIITEDGMAKVTDFGIAKAVTNATMTAFGNTMGSVHYLSPEHARGGNTDAQSDIYSLGVVMYEMVTGRVPFDADTAVSVALKQVQEKPIAPIELNKKIPQGLNYIILKAMEKEPKLRYKDAADLLIDLEILIKNSEVDFNNLDEKVKESVTRILPIIPNSINKETIGNKQSIFEKKKWLRPVMWISIAILVVILTMVITIVLGKKDNGESYIPNLTGEFGEERLTKDEAIKQLELRGFKYEIIEEYNKDVEKDRVIKQEPKFQDNYKLKTGTVFKIYISKGEEMVDLPKDLVGKDVEEVKKQLTEKELQYEIREEFNEEKDNKKGIVFKIEPDPAKTEKIGKSEKIIIYVSKGPEKVKVKIPKDLIGKDISEVKGILEKLKLKVKEKYEIIDGLQQGMVLSLEPSEDAEVEEKSTVTVTVAKYPELKEGVAKINLKKLFEQKDGVDFSKPGAVKNIQLTVKVNNEVFRANKTYRNDDEDVVVPFKVKDDKRPKELVIIIDGEIKEKITVNIGSKTQYDIPNA